MRVSVVLLASISFALGFGVPTTVAYGQTQAGAASVPTASGGYKIGIVSRVEALRQYDKQKSEYAQLKADMAKLQKPLDEMTDKITADKKRYDAEKDKMSEDKRQALQDEIQEEYQDYEAEMKKNQGIVDDKEKRVLQGLNEDFEKAVKHVGDAENFHLILEGNPEAPNRTVLYFSKTIDVTPEVIAYLNSHADTSVSARAAKSSKLPRLGRKARRK